MTDNSRVPNDKQKELNTQGDLFERVASILEAARASTVRAINNQMVLSYWLIGREIVNEIQSGEERAEYGRQVIEKLSQQLKNYYDRGFSTTNLRYFRTFYTVYSDRVPEIRQIRSGESQSSINPHPQMEILNDLTLAVETMQEQRGFSPVLGWSHYQALLSVDNRNERLFYEIEAEKEGWDVKHLKRQIYTFLFARLIKSTDKAELKKDRLLKNLRMQ
jgi:DUF1016 N-terminal domain